MLNHLKSTVLRTAGQLLASQTALGILTHPQFQDALKRAINLRSDVRDGWERQVDSLARSFNLVTRQDVKMLKRSIRELENQTATLEYELRQQRERADRAEDDAAKWKKAGAAAEAQPSNGKTRAGKKAAAPKKAAQGKAAKKKKPARKKASSTSRTSST